MEIKSNMKNNYLKHYNIAKGIAVNKRIVLKNKTTKVPTYLTSALITIIILTILSVLFLIIDKSKIFSSYFKISLIIYIIYIIVRTIWSYNFKKKNNFQNTIVLNEEGLTDTSFYDIKINIKWNKIKAIVIKKSTITILTDTHLYFFFDIKEKDQVLKSIRQYSKNTPIIE